MNLNRQEYEREGFQVAVDVAYEMDKSMKRRQKSHLPSISQYVIVEFDAHSWDWPHLATFEVRHVTSYRINIKSMFVFSGLTSFFIDFNFCRQIKSLFIFSLFDEFFAHIQFFPSRLDGQAKSLFDFRALASFPLNFNFSCKINSLLIFSVLTIFHLNLLWLIPAPGQNNYLDNVALLHYIVELEKIRINIDTG